MADEGSDKRATLRTIFDVLRDPHLEPEEKTLWGLYRSYEGPSGKGAYPGDGLLAEHLDRSPRTVRRLRRRLLELGYLRQKLRGPKPASYRAVLPDAAEEPDTPAPEEGGDDGDQSESYPAPSDLQKDDAGQYVYPPAFETTWSIYPDRDGPNPKKASYRKWRAQVRNGAEPDELHEATEALARRMDAEGTTGSRYVMQATTFFGPDEHWREELEADAPKSVDPSRSRHDALGAIEQGGRGE